MLHAPSCPPTPQPFLGPLYIRDALGLLTATLQNNSSQHSGRAAASSAQLADSEGLSRSAGMLASAWGARLSAMPEPSSSSVCKL